MCSLPVGLLKDMIVCLAKALQVCSVLDVLLVQCCKKHHHIQDAGLRAGAFISGMGAKQEYLSMSTAAYSNTTVSLVFLRANMTREHLWCPLMGPSKVGID